ncbi:unnamed protein product [Cuscuta europaea]|uniref:Uncharacterized protein n=1 Tax=Cuscuta europaea TaxID=41803 RepID=A0A9P0ZQ19_CUSEU|nr:unnamed protein product [Cuscuta europaea]
MDRSIKNAPDGIEERTLEFITPRSDAATPVVDNDDDDDDDAKRPGSLSASRFTARCTRSSLVKFCPPPFCSGRLRFTRIPLPSWRNPEVVAAELARNIETEITVMTTTGQDVTGKEPVISLPSFPGLLQVCYFFERRIFALFTEFLIPTRIV